MTELDVRYLDAFSGYLKTLAADVEVLARGIDDESLGVPARLPLAAGLNYLFKSLDLIDDGIEGLGYLDDAFVLRSLVAEVRGDLNEELSRLANEANVVREFLGDLGARFDTYLAGLRDVSVRGRTAMQIVSDGATRAEFLSDVRNFTSRYERPAFVQDPMNLVKLRAFLAAKLPK